MSLHVLLRTITVALFFCSLTIAWSDRIHDAVMRNDYAKVKALLDQTPGFLEKKDAFGKTPLLIAASHGEVAITKLLLEKHALVDTRDREGVTPLLAAAAEGQLEVITVLLDYKANTGAVSYKGNSFLHCAVASGNLDIVKLAMKNGGNVHLGNDAECTPLHFALGESGERYGNFGNTMIEETDGLLSKAIDVLPEGDRKAAEDILAHVASDNATLNVVRYLVEHDADINQANVHGVTPLLAAAKTSNSGVINFLLKIGADISAQDEDGHTFLHFAAATKDESLIRLALDKGCAANARDDFGNTPLHFALDIPATGELDFFGLLTSAFAQAFNGIFNDETADSLHDLLENNPELRKLIEKISETGQQRVETMLRAYMKDPLLPVITILVNHGADVNAVNTDGNAPILGVAALCGMETLNLLIEKGAKVTACNEQGQTALHSACMAEKPNVIKILVEKGCPVNVQTIDGTTPLHMAVSAADLASVNLLLSKGAAVNTADGQGRLPIHFALSRCSYTYNEQGKILISDNGKIITALRKAGANINAQDDEGNTLMHEAARQGMSAKVKILLEKGAKPNLVNKEGEIPLQLAKEALAKAIADKEEKREVNAARESVAILQKAGNTGKK